MKITTLEKLCCAPSLVPGLVTVGVHVDVLETAPEPGGRVELRTL